MKFILSFFLGALLLWVAPGFSQVTAKGLLVIKNGSILHYTADDHGSTIHFPVTVLSRGKDGVVFQYSVSHGDKSISGKIYVMGEAVENGGSLNQNGLNPGEERKLTADETFFFFSRHFYKELLKNKTAKYDNTEYAIMKMPPGKEIFIGKKKVNAIYMYSKEAGTAYWILNDPEFPLILKSDGDKKGPDFTLADVTMKP